MGHRIEIFDLADIPLFDEDVRAAGPPLAITRFKDAVRTADGLLICTPEYNHSIPGVLKNAIDWLSRPPAESPLAGKPAGIVGASDGPVGTARAQQHLRLVLAATGVNTMVRPMVGLPYADKLIDAEGELADAKSLSRIADFVADLVEWTRFVADRPT